MRDLIAIAALLGSARFFLALAGLDVGTSFGGIGSSREVMIASLAEPGEQQCVPARTTSRTSAKRANEKVSSRTTVSTTTALRKRRRRRRR